MGETIFLTLIAASKQICLFLFHCAVLKHKKSQQTLKLSHFL